MSYWRLVRLGPSVRAKANCLVPNCSLSYNYRRSYSYSCSYSSAYSYSSDCDRSRAVERRRSADSLRTRSAPSLQLPNLTHEFTRQFSSRSTEFVDNDADARAAEDLLDTVSIVEQDLLDTVSSKSSAAASSETQESLRKRQLAIFGKALIHAEKAAARGSPRAKTLLGYLYRDGLGVAQDREKARSLFIDSAQSGDPYAQLPLGKMILESVESTNPTKSGGPEIVVKVDERGAPKAQYADNEQQHSTAPETPAQLVRKIRKARHKAGFSDQEAQEFARHEELQSRDEYKAMREDGIRWLRAANDQGCDEAAVALANAVVDENPEEARELYERAAKRSRVPSAHFNLGQLYKDGVGSLEKDTKAALKHFSMAAQLGDADAQFFVGHIYRVGEMGVEVDLASCRQFIESAAEQRHPGALYYLALLHRNGEGGLEASRGGFRRFLEASAELEHPEALFCLADMYYKGTDGVHINKQKALDLYERAGRAGSNEALCSAAAMHFHGYGSGDSDKHQAFLLYQEAAIRGSTPALRNIASMYYHGEGVPKSDTIAEHFLKEAEAHEQENARVEAELVSRIGVEKQDAPSRGMPHNKSEADQPPGGTGAIRFSKTETD